MKKSVYVGMIVAVAIVFTFGTAQAGNGNNGLSGPHWQFNIIGHPKNIDAISGDNSNGRAIMVPLKNVKDRGDLICPEDTDAVFVNDTEPTFDLVPTGAKIYFEASDHFEITDRDATDASGASVLIPSTLAANPLYDPEACAACAELTGPERERCEAVNCSEFENVIAVDVWVRVLGKPNTCMNINGFAYDQWQDLYFWSGRIELARKAGQATWINVNDIFRVWWCDTTDCEGTAEEISVFNDVFESYFWDVLNDGTRLVQVRLYPVTAED